MLNLKNFEMRCYCKILSISWNDDVLNRIKQNRTIIMKTRKYYKNNTKSQKVYAKTYKPKK